MTSKTTWNTGNNLLNNAVLNKLHTPRNQSSRDPNKITSPGQHELMPLVRESMQRNLDAENVNEMLPDLDFVADIVVSGILSSKDQIIRLEITFHHVAIHETTNPFLCLRDE